MKSSGQPSGGRKQQTFLYNGRPLNRLIFKLTVHHPSKSLNRRGCDWSHRFGYFLVGLSWRECPLWPGLNQHKVRVCVSAWWCGPGPRQEARHQSGRAGICSLIIKPYVTISLRGVFSFRHCHLPNVGIGLGRWRWLFGRHKRLASIYQKTCIEIDGFGRPNCRCCCLATCLPAIDELHLSPAANDYFCRHLTEKSTVPNLIFTRLILLQLDLTFAVNDGNV